MKRKEGGGDEGGRRDSMKGVADDSEGGVRHGKRKGEHEPCLLRYLE